MLLCHRPLTRYSSTVLPHFRISVKFVKQSFSITVLQKYSLQGAGSACSTLYFLMSISFSWLFHGYILHLVFTFINRRRTNLLTSLVFLLTTILKFRCCTQWGKHAELYSRWHGISGGAQLRRHNECQPYFVPFSLLFCRPLRLLELTCACIDKESDASI